MFFVESCFCKTRSSCPEVFYKNNALENLTILKRDHSRDFFWKLCKIVRNTFYGANTDGHFYKNNIQQGIYINMRVNKLYQISGKCQYEMSEWKYDHIWNCHKYQIEVCIFKISIYEKRIRWVFVIKNNLSLVMNLCA